MSEIKPRVFTAEELSAKVAKLRESRALAPAPARQPLAMSAVPPMLQPKHARRARRRAVVPFHQLPLSERRKHNRQSGNT